MVASEIAHPLSNGWLQLLREIKKHCILKETIPCD